MRTRFNNAFILSAQTDTENRNDELQKDLEGLPYKKVLGSYKGQIEESFLVIAPSNKLPDVFKKYKQESMLQQNEDGYIYLVYKDRTEKLGERWNTSKQKPDVDAWALVDDTYYWI